MPSCWGEFTRLLSSSINNSIEKNPQISRSHPRGLLGSVTLMALVLGWCRWRRGLWSGVVLLVDKHDPKAFPYKRGEIIVATQQIRFKCISVILPVPGDRFLF